MREKENKEQYSKERRREGPEEAPARKSIGDPAPIDDDTFARRAGQIIARAVRGVKSSIAGKRKYSVDSPSALGERGHGGLACRG
jgi:hypothetical protein